MPTQKGRNDLYGDNNDTFYPNLNKEIEASEHNLYNEDMIASKFNLIDDEVPLLWWDKTNNITLNDYIESQDIIKQKGGAFFPSTINQVSGTDATSIYGDCTSGFATRNTSGATDTFTYTLEFTDSITDYVAEIYIRNGSNYRQLSYNKINDNSFNFSYSANNSSTDEVIFLIKQV